MVWYLYKSQVLCENCAEGKTDVVKIGELEKAVCAECGVEELIERGAYLIKAGKRSKTVCPKCARKLEKTLFKSADAIFHVDEDEEVPVPLWCDECGAYIPTRLPAEAEVVLMKAVETLDDALFDERLRTVRPALWEKVYRLKEKLSDCVLFGSFANKDAVAKAQAADDELSAVVERLEDIIFSESVRKRAPEVIAKAIELKEQLEELFLGQ